MRMRNPAALTLSAATLVFASFADAEQPNAAMSGAEKEAPESAALAVGALQTAADAALSLTAMDISVATNKIVYTYSFKNSGANPLDLTASVVMPNLEASADNSEFWTLPKIPWD